MKLQIFANHSLCNTLKNLPNAIHLDGDDLRKIIGKQKTDYDYNGREKLAFIYARLVAFLAQQGHMVIISTIALFSDIHTWNRQNISDYIEIFLDIPEDVRRKRDIKQLYSAATDSQTQLAGGSVPVEYPRSPHERFDENWSIEKATQHILNTYIKDNIDAR